MFLCDIRIQVLLYFILRATLLVVYRSPYYKFLKSLYIFLADSLCGLVVRVLGYRSEGPLSIPGTTRKKAVGLERGPLSLVSTTEELLD
jgi:hypothetical protein